MSSHNNKKKGTTKSGKRIAEILILLMIFTLLFEGCSKIAGNSSGERSGKKSDTETVVQTEGFSEEESVASAESPAETMEDPIGQMLDDSGYDYVREGDRFFVFYYQDGESWSDMDHGYDATSTIAESGCGSVSLAMVLTALTQDIEDYTPDKIVQSEIDNQILAPSKSVDSLVEVNEAMDTGCKVKYHSGDLDLDTVDEVLAEGGYIILDQMADTGRENAKVFANFNHYIVIRGGNQTDGYFIANSLRRFSASVSKEQYAPQNTTCIPAEMFEAKYWYTVTG